MKPSIGRIVHYVAYGTPGGEFQVGAHRAAIVTEVFSDTAVRLCILNPTGLYFSHTCCLDATGSTPGSWHWPERVE